MFNLEHYFKEQPIKASKNAVFLWSFLARFIVLAVLFALPYSAWAGGNKEQGNQPQPNTQTQPAAVVTPQQPASPVYWTGDAGRGKSITILPPRNSGLADNQAYLPDFVSNELVSNFNTFSAMTLFDRVNNQKQYDELLSGFYADDDPAGLDLGHLSSTDYMLLGTITRTSSGYALQLAINNNSDKTTIATHSQTLTIAELDDLSGVRRASLDLLTQMGIQLTDRAIADLSMTSSQQSINAQAALARGITAQRSGTVVEALNYYYQAAAFDSSLLEAANRSSVLSTAVTSGNIGENVRNDIQRRNEWKKILDEADDLFSRNLPFEIVYDPRLTQGRIDYNRGRVDLSFEVSVNPNATAFKVLEDIRKGLIATGKVWEWGFEFWPLFYFGPGQPLSKARMFNTYMIHFIPQNKERGIITIFDIAVSLINEDGKIISESRKNLLADILLDDRNRDPYSLIRIGFLFLPHQGYQSNTFIFSSVNVNDITDKLTVQINSVNGVNVQDPANQGYIRITAGSLR